MGVEYMIEMGVCLLVGFLSFLIMTLLHKLSEYRRMKCPYESNERYYAVLNVFGDWNVCPVFCASVTVRDDVLYNKTIWVASFLGVNDDSKASCIVTSEDANRRVFKSKGDAIEHLEIVRLANELSKVEVVEL